MRALTLALAAAAMLIAAVPASAQKNNPWCDQAKCVAACEKNGGQGRFCPQYCQKRIREDKRCQ